MASNIFGEKLSLVQPQASDDTFDIPIDINDIIEICKEYSKLGFKIQYQIQNIMEFGVQHCLDNHLIYISSLPLIKDFLNSICANAWFGDACLQANDCIALIEDYELKNPHLVVPSN